MFGQASAFATGSAQNPMKDVEVTQPPGDSISKLAFSPNANYLVAASWDNNVCLLSTITQWCSSRPLPPACCCRSAAGKCRITGRVSLRPSTVMQPQSWTAAGMW